MKVSYQALARYVSRYVSRYINICMYMASFNYILNDVNVLGKYRQKCIAACIFAETKLEDDVKRIMNYMASNMLVTNAGKTVLLVNRPKILQSRNTTNYISW